MIIAGRPRSLLDRIPMLVKALAVTMAVGAAAWFAADHYGVRALSSTFEGYVSEGLEARARGYRLRFNRHVNAHQQLALIMATQNSLVQHVVKDGWESIGMGGAVVHKISPRWMPGNTLLRTFVTPRFAMLIDESGRVRELYSSLGWAPPEGLMPPSRRLLMLSRGESHLTYLDGIPYLVTTERVRDKDRGTGASLMLASPVDEEFLIASQGAPTTDFSVLLVDTSNKVIASSNSSMSPPGANLEEIANNYLVLDQKFYEFGGSEMNFRFVSIVPKSTVDEITSEIISRDRLRQSVQALMFLFAFAALMYFYVTRVKGLTRRVAEFSRRNLGGHHLETGQWDELFILEYRFSLLTEEVRHKEELIRAEAEDSARREEMLRSVENRLNLLSSVTKALEIGVAMEVDRSLVPMNEKMEHFFEMSGEPDCFNVPQGKEHEMEMRYRDGSLRHFHVVSPELGLEGKIVMAIDITRRKESELRIESLASIVSQAAEGIAMAAMDGTITYANEAWAGMHGYAADDVIGRPMSLFHTEEQMQRDVLPFNERVLENDTNRGEVGHVRGDGTEFPTYMITSVLRDKHGDATGLVGFATDITDLKRVMQEAVESRHDWESTFDSITDMITIHDKHFNIIAANRAARDSLALPCAKENKCFKFYHGMDLPPGGCPSCESLITGKPSTSEIYEPHLGKDIEVRAIPRFDAEGKVNGLIHVVRDISIRKRLEKELMQHALYDSLTSLPNRVLFMDRLANLFDHAKRQPDLLFAVLFLDLDHFKKVNDSLGHVMGDAMLRSVAERLKRCTRPGDTISRFGGDEFVVILDWISSEADAIVTAERIQSEMKAPFYIEGHEVFTSVSTGIAVNHRKYSGPEDLLRDADTAMYHAKARGRAGHAVFDHKMHSTVLESVKLENDLRKAVERDEFELHYQPIVSMEEGRVAGFEALIRWRHPSRGTVPPEEFIPLAEETGLINAIGSWVIKAAARQAARWRGGAGEGAPPYISINISARQFGESLPVQMATVLKNNAIPPEALKLEITESVIMADADLARRVLMRLREMNIQVYLDDFGTGYSSLNYVHKFPVSALKIDRSFVKNMAREPESREIVRAISYLGHNLGISIIIEGIEHPEELELFRSIRCDYVQGYVFAPPMPAGEAQEYLRRFSMDGRKP